MYNVPEVRGNFSKSQYKFSVVFTPLSETSSTENAIPMIDMRNSTILRCEWCGCFVNPNFIFKDGGNKYTCNMCEMEGWVD